MSDLPGEGNEQAAEDEAAGEGAATTTEVQEPAEGEPRLPNYAPDGPATAGERGQC